MSFIENAKEMFGFQSNKPTLTKKEVAQSYQHRPSITSRLPWRDYNEKYRCVLLEDNQSLGVCFKVNPIPCEARPEAMMQEIAKSISEAIKNSLPCEKDNPWILQVYVQKTSDLSECYREIEDSFPKDRKKNPLTQDFLKNIKEHFDYLAEPGGVFHDSLTNTNFGGSFLNVYAVLYRRIKIKKQTNDSKRTHLEDIVRISRKFADQMRGCGMRISRMRGQELYTWLAKWFNPKLKFENTSYPAETAKPIGFDFAEQLFFSTPESFEEGWLFDGLPHKVVTIQNMTTKPNVGHISAERKRNTDDKIFNLIDHMPEGSIFVIALVLEAPSETEKHLAKINNSAVGKHAQALAVKSEIAFVEKSVADGDMLFPVVMNVYLSGTSLEALHSKEAQLEVLLNGNGFKVITDDELYPIDAYLRYLPMCYDYYFDKANSYRSRYMLLSEIVKLLPFYGRSRGTKNPGMIMFNRGGEPWYYDLFKDKTKNSHFLLLGETGTGKSNLLAFLITHCLALYNPRIFIIEVGGSFNLLGDYLKQYGLTVNKVKIDSKNPISLNPFAHGLKVIEQIESLKAPREKIIEDECNKLLVEQEKNATFTNTAEEENEDEPRDILGEMVLAALTMITGSEKKEEENIRRSDRMMIMDAIIDAAYYVRDQKRDQMIAEDIVNAFERVALKLDPKRDAEKIRRAREMADGMRYFTTDPISSQFFNSYGTPWPLADITIVDFGLFANEGYEAQRSIAYAGCMSKVISLAELNQNSNRPMVLVHDEVHIFSSVASSVNTLTRVSKTGRKLGLWLWLATQNLIDFPDGARRILSQCEHWMCLALPSDELEQIEHFKKLTAEERALCLSAQKEPGKFTEGVVLSPTIKALFRNVPPRRYLVLAATDQNEKNLRARTMIENKCSEIEAVNIIAKNMMIKQVGRAL